MRKLLYSPFKTHLKWKPLNSVKSNKLSLLVYKEANQAMLLLLICMRVSIKK